MRSSLDKQNGIRRGKKWKAVTERQQMRRETELWSGLGAAGT